MYENWICRRWETPISDRLASMEALTDSDGLTLLVSAARPGERSRRYTFFFERPAGYRNLLEEYRTELWNLFLETSRPGSTFTVENSPWIEEIASREPLLMVHDRDVVHYVIAMDDVVVEILSSRPPTISPASD